MNRPLKTRGKLDKKTVNAVSASYIANLFQLATFFVLVVTGCRQNQPVVFDPTFELRKEIQSASSERRFNAIETLRFIEIPDDFLDLLVETLADKDKRVRRSTIAAIIKMVRKDPFFIQKIHQLMPKINEAIQVETDEVTKSMLFDLLDRIQSASNFSRNGNFDGSTL